LLFTSGSFGVAEVDRQEAYAYVTEQLVTDPQAFNRGFVETLSLLLLKNHRFPVHAATIARNGTAVLLAGASGYGKSTLAYAASRDGLDALGDDIAHIQLHPARRVWTLPSRYSLLRDVARRWDELSSAVPTRLPTGKTKVVVQDDRWTSSNTVDSFGVCLLERGSGAASLETIGSDELKARLVGMNAPGFDIYSDDDRRSVLGAISEPGGWKLRLSRDPQDSLPLIHNMLSALDRGR
jgi:hypothetical protein